MPAPATLVGAPDAPATALEWSPPLSELQPTGSDSRHVAKLKIGSENARFRLLPERVVFRELVVTRTSSLTAVLQRRCRLAPVASHMVTEQGCDGKKPCRKLRASSLRDFNTCRPELDRPHNECATSSLVSAFARRPIENCSVGSSTSLSMFQARWLLQKSTCRAPLEPASDEPDNSLQICSGSSAIFRF